MIPIPPASRRPARLAGLVTPLAVLVALVVLLLLPNLLMYTGLRSPATPASTVDSGTRPGATAAVESRLMMR